MPHIKPKAGQRVIVRELRGCMEQDGIKVGDVGMTMRLPNGDLGVQFAHLYGIFVRYAPGDSFVVDCCGAPECVTNVTPVRLVVVSQQPRRDGYHIRRGMHKAKYVLHPNRPILRMVTGVLLHRLGKKRAPGMTAKGIKWALTQEDQEIRA